MKIRILPPVKKSLRVRDKKDNIVEITLPKGNKQIFASQYKTYLPTKEELQAQIESVEVKQ